MSSPAAYCPQTLATIRACAARGMGPLAIAVVLRWPLDRLVRVARDHGIDLVIVGPQDVTEAKALPVAQPAPAAAPRPLRPSSDLQALIMSLPARVGAVVTVLARGDGSEWMSSTMIAAGFPESISVAAVSENAQRAQRALVRIGAAWRIESTKGRGGGYRLIKRSATAAAGSADPARATPSSAQSP